MMQIIWDGLFVGSFYALIALGYSMVYGIIKLLNFAHGDIYMLGAFIGFVMLASVGGLPGALSIGALLVVLLLSMLLTGGAGVLIERFAYRPLRNAPRLAVLITAVGVSFTLQYGVSAIAGPNPRSYPVRLEGDVFDVLGARVSLPQVLLMAIAAILMIALNTYIQKTSTGRAMRSISLDMKGSLLMGINVNSVITRTFFIGSALAGAAGVMAGAYYGKIDFMMGFLIGLKAFTAAVIGGIGNIQGAMLGGLVLGLIEAFGASVFGGEWRDVFAFVVLILFLTLRPTGILGERVTERV
ncbi:MULTISPECIES: branched-chain amino acid ABC transporter permease [Cryobacterium]|uniref:Branched-chain amino acid ABC transporter permease n=1 Tax=Cryobacterium levicorallinum TaxID=995038 RepID=A0A1I2YNU6_9MICO|nr:MULTISPECIES: branched-chain amino acid ABC transporter permease [Cryobacterium]TFB86085.1 branched-chain amino acid ABC transporter permease [Cryobacterium levicorallinum]TFD60321.1 branched-chain amino acid ABC transporter permease [Cryobacterium sp. Hh38]GEP27617.1 branched-chain amino acid ABC transporter permease [Cryobacterium levicorallinum]SFH27303.1 branched-chain amino acid transport system permease protein [Cryobacterium levicorallinum]